MNAEKCPECGMWWRGFEHRCPPTVTTNSVLRSMNPSPAVLKALDEIEAELDAEEQQR